MAIWICGLDPSVSFWLSSLSIQKKASMKLKNSIKEKSVTFINRKTFLNSWFVSDLILQRSWLQCSESAGRPFTSSGSCGAPSASGPIWCTTFISTSTSCRASSSTSAQQSTLSSTACSPRGSGSVSENSCAPRRRITAPSETRHPSPRFYSTQLGPAPELRLRVRTPTLSSPCCLRTWHWARTPRSSHVFVTTQPARPLCSNWIIFFYKLTKTTLKE